MAGAASPALSFSSAAAEHTHRNSLRGPKHSGPCPLRLAPSSRRRASIGTGRRLTAAPLASGQTGGGPRRQPSAGDGGAPPPRAAQEAAGAAGNFKWRPARGAPASGGASRPAAAGKPAQAAPASAEEPAANVGARAEKPVAADLSPVGRVADAALRATEDLVNALLAASSPSGPPGRFFLRGNFAPTEEKGPLAGLEVEGTLPACLNGEFVRNGPNPQFPPKHGYHWFVGDGMLHGVRISSGSASYVCRFMRTARFEQERRRGGAVFFKFADAMGVPGLLRMLLHGARALLRLESRRQGEGTGWGEGTANTAVVFHAGSLLALHEGDAPYLMRILADGDLETRGRFSYSGALQHNFTAHPKIDPETGELFGFGYTMASPGITYRVVSKDGTMGPPVPISLPRPVMMHDFAITEHYAVFLDLSLVADVSSMVLRGTLPIVFDGTHPVRIGVLPRYAATEAEIQWFPVQPCCVFHVANAWEETTADGDTEVVLLACRYPHMDLRHYMQPLPGVAAFLHEYRLNLQTGKSSERQLSPHACEFPRINDAVAGRHGRFVYAAAEAFPFHYKGIAKFDLGPGAHASPSDCTAALFEHGPGRWGSEPVFVPREAEEGEELEEDDGYLLSFVFDSNTGTSDFVVVDAKSMTQVARVKLRCNVPHGFHGIFVSEEELASQLP